jgi:hypothetical protein
VLTHLAPGGLRRELGRCVEHLLGHLWRRHAGEKDAELGQRLGQLQPFIAVSSWKCVGQLVPFGSNLCILTQPNTFLAADQSLYRHGPRQLGRAHVPDGQVGHLAFQASNTGVLHVEPTVFKSQPLSSFYISSVWRASFACTSALIHLAHQLTFQLAVLLTHLE